MSHEITSNSVHMNTRAEWRRWLRQNHKRTEGVWLITYKKSTGKTRLAYDDAVEEALCFGWIDSKPRKPDEDRSMLRFSPRKAATVWSKLNKDRIDGLIARHLMQPAGLAKVEAAKRDGTWVKLDAVEALEIPGDVAAALTKYESAANFHAFPRSVSRGILEWIGNAKPPDTRAKRVEETASLAGRNVCAKQWPQRS
jgi:uncharacterized protein YdeI (YjbR/CyaY-like superfamily)